MKDIDAGLLAAVDAEGEDPVMDIHRRMVRLLRKCKPLQRRWLKALPEYDWMEYRAGVRLGHSRHTIFRWLRVPHIKEYIELRRELDVIEIGVNHASLIRAYHREEQADISRLTDRATGKILPPSEWPEDMKKCVTEYGFDKNGNPYVRIADHRGARDRLAKYLKMFVDRHELTGLNGSPLASVVPVVQIVPYPDEPNEPRAAPQD
jgi:hypothetical protein